MRVQSLLQDNQDNQLLSDLDVGLQLEPTYSGYLSRFLSSVRNIPFFPYISQPKTTSWKCVSGNRGNYLGQL